MATGEMNLHQMMAYGSPCFEAEETQNPRFQWLEERGGLTMSVILTANIGLE